MEKFGLNVTEKVKGVAILLLIFHHMYRTVEDIVERGAIPLLIDMNTISRIAFCCRVCVYVFVMLSAYGMSIKIKTSNETSPIGFVITRYIKLIMPYWFTLICIWFYWIIGLQISPLERYNGNIKYAIADFFSVLEIMGHTENMFSGVFWYMNFAIVEIILLPLVYNICKK